MNKPSYNQKIKLTIHSLGRHGEGVGYWQGYTVFVDDALPGEVIQGNITQAERKFGRAKAMHYEVSSVDRVKPLCPIFGQCGGCQLMHLSYEGQLTYKRQRLVDAFNKYAALTDVEIFSCMASPSPFAYRNKIQMPITGSVGDVKIGLFARNSRDVIDIGDCAVHCELGEHVFQKIRPLFSKYPIVPYNFETGQGQFRYLLVKTAVNTSEVLVTFVVNELDRHLLKTLAEEIHSLCPEVKGVVCNLHPLQNNVVLGDVFETLSGRSYIVEQLGDLKFHISAASFFQVNTHQAEALYRYAMHVADLNENTVAVDAYCGVGTLSLLIAQKAGKVIGMECVPAAIEDAKQNALFNQMENAHFICCKTEDQLKYVEKADIIFVNPPRKGCEKAVLEEIARLNPQQMIYISCDPLTLARDLDLMLSLGYKIASVQPFDMFPQTAHVETVVKLKKS